MTETSQMLVSDDVLIIERLEVRNADLCSYVKGFALDEQVERVRDALIIGAEVLQKARARSEVDYIDKRFAEVSKEFGERISGVVTGTTSGISTLVNDTKEALTKLLSPRDNGSPLKERFEALDALVGAIKTELTTEHAKLRESTAALATQFDINGGDASHLVKLKKHINDFETRVKDLFDPKHDDSYFKQLTTHLNGIFDPKAGSLPGLLDERLAFAKPDSPFGQFKKEVEDKLSDMREKVVESIGSLKAEIEAYRAARRERSTSAKGGTDFEIAAGDALRERINRVEDSYEETRNKTGGAIRNSKVGDHVQTLNPESRGGGLKIVYECKKEAGYTASDALKELAVARENRQAEIGVFIMAASTVRTDSKVAQEFAQPFRRFGQDLLIVWDHEDPGSDIILDVVVSVARALAVRDVVEGTDATDWTAIDRHLNGLYGQLAHLEEMRNWCGTITSRAKDIEDRLRIMREQVDRDCLKLKEYLGTLRP